MSDLGSSSRKQATAFGQYRAILGAKSLQQVVRKTLAVAFVGAVYALIGVVMSEAYHEFGQQSLRDVPPLVLADRTPVKIPGDPRQVRTAPRDRSHSAPSATLPFESGDRASAESRVVQATAPLLADRPSSPADRLVWIERSATERQDTGPAEVARGNSEQPPAEIAAGSATAARGPADAPAAAAATDVPPPAPVLKPLELIPIVVVGTLRPIPRPQRARSGLLH
jgi:hypothetical protein